MLHPTSSPLHIALVGYGYWGPNLARNFHQLAGVKLAYVVDPNPAARAQAEQRYGCATAARLDEILADPALAGVVVATPARTHFTLARDALAAGKHVLVEKPLTMDLDEGAALIALARQQQLTLMVGHVFEYNPAVRYIKTLIEQGELGEIFYLYSRRVNLGRVQSDVNALWSIAPHDISIVLYLLGQMPDAVRCQGASCLNDNVEDVVFLTLFFPNNLLCHVHASWLDPSKTREMTVVGSHKMVVYDDVSAEGKVRIYDKGAFRKGDVTYGDFQYKLHSGDILIPRLDLHEPLQMECAHWIDCIRTGSRPLTDGENGLRVLKVLDAGERSLRQEGAKIVLAK
ncbi:MAG: Gfo/Idh/MocA family oxidoreductase [Caldilinea sp.]|jgi:predicted dehydrogenase|nr:Gfo/Idh/MocA family oxidoreductase [Caldilinea sp.]